MGTVLIFVAILGFLVIVHELGHFGAAKIAKVRVLEFAIGYPPRIFAIKRGETTYSLNLLPLGGFVRLFGEEDPTHPESFTLRSPWVRLAVLSAGALMNAALPFVLLAIVFVIPQEMPRMDVVIVGVSSGSPAEVAGMRRGDIIQAVDGQNIDRVSDLRRAVYDRLGTPMIWMAESGGRIRELELTPRRNPPVGEGAAGISLIGANVRVFDIDDGSAAFDVGLRRDDLLVSVDGHSVLDVEDVSSLVSIGKAEKPDGAIIIEVLRSGEIISLNIPSHVSELNGYNASAYSPERRSQPPWTAIVSSVREVGTILSLLIFEVSRWTNGEAPQFAGPIGIAHMTGEVARGGVGPLITWTALLSINLAILNLLPLPALDGGRIAFILLELVRGGRRLAPEKERIVHLAGFGLILLIVGIVSVEDIQRLLS
jgi:regulator of sigma E protease